MKKWTGGLVVFFLLGIGSSHTSCVKSGCPTEIQATKVKKRKKLSKKAKSNLFSDKMRKEAKRLK